MKSLKIVSLAIVFILSLVKNFVPNPISYIKNNYGHQQVKVYRKFLTESSKLQKCKLDLLFLTKCKTYDVIPKFLRFKLYRKSLQSQQFYKSWQVKLLDQEIVNKKQQISSLQDRLLDTEASVRQNFRLLDQTLVNRTVGRILRTENRSITRTHENKLIRLGIQNDLNPCDPEKVVHNYSDVNLPTRVKFLLAFGLDFNLPIRKLSLHTFYTPLEKLAYTLSKEKCTANFRDFLSKLKFNTYKYFNEFNPRKVFSPIFTECDVKLLSKFSKNKNIIVTKPDKGRGVVILNKDKYLESMSTILSDSSKFRIISDPIRKYCTKIEDKINRFLSQLKHLNCIDEETYRHLYVAGSAPGIMYGLPKIHKSDFSAKFQFRPILAAYNQASYKISKFLVPILQPFTTNQYTVSNSSEFSRIISTYQDAENYYMASFDIESLFTSIPLHETIQIGLKKLFSDQQPAKGITAVPGFTKDLFRKLLEHAVLNSFFLFGGTYYKQVEGLGMGLPLGPTFANMFMCHHEDSWLKDCPPVFAPVRYLRYVDDTFLLFREKSHAPQFLNYLNSKHPSIKFTVELEHNNSLSFLDVSVSRAYGKFTTSIFRKSSFSGLGLSYFSHCCKKFKLNVVRTLLHRAYAICSNYHLLHNEFVFLKQFFSANGYPKFLIESMIKSFLNYKLDSPHPITTVSRKPIYFSLPYFGHTSVQMKIYLCNLISEYFPHIDPKIILVNKFKISTFFSFKDSLPSVLRSGVVYKYRCANCASAYVGSTIRSLHTRICEHKGLSHRTGAPLVRPPQSSIRDHALTCSSDISVDNFKIVAYLPSELSLRICESIFIFSERTKLNDLSSAFPLKLLPI